MADNYEVISQQQVIARTDDGTLGEVKEIKFRTKPSQQIGTVRVPVAQFTPDHVAALLDAEAQTIETVQNL